MRSGYQEGLRHIRELLRETPVREKAQWEPGRWERDSRPQSRAVTCEEKGGTGRWGRKGLRL